MYRSRSGPWEFKSLRTPDPHLLPAFKPCAGLRQQDSRNQALPAPRSPAPPLAVAPESTSDGGPGDDETGVTAAQLREVAARLIAAGHREDGGPPVIIVMDSGYSVARLAWRLRTCR